MKINLDYEIKIEVQEGGKKKESFSVFYREFNKKEKSENKKKVKELQRLWKESNKLERKFGIIGKRINAFEELEKFEEVITLLDEQETHSDRLDAIVEEMEKFGGDEANEKFAKDKFEKTVSGKDADKLKEYAEVKGYGAILNLLDQAKEGLDKKQSGK